MVEVAPRYGQAAIDYTRGRIGGTMPDGSGYCLKFVRQDYEVPSYYASAIDAWNGAADQHPDDRNPPPGVPMFFWSSSIYRHVAFHLGDGQYATTYNEEIRQYPLSSMESIYGPVIGWTSDLNVHYVHDPRPTPEPPPDEEDDMRPWFIRRNDGFIVIVSPTGVRGVTFDQWQTYTNLGYATFGSGFDNMDPGPFGAVVDSLGGLVG